MRVWQWASFLQREKREEERKNERARSLPLRLIWENVRVRSGVAAVAARGWVHFDGTVGKKRMIRRVPKRSMRPSFYCTRRVGACVTIHLRKLRNVRYSFRSSFANCDSTRPRAMSLFWFLPAAKGTSPFYRMLKLCLRENRGMVMDFVFDFCFDGDVCFNLDGRVYVNWSLEQRCRTSVGDAICMEMHVHVFVSVFDDGQVWVHCGPGIYQESGEYRVMGRYRWEWEIEVEGMEGFQVEASLEIRIWTSMKYICI